MDRMRPMSKAPRDGTAVVLWWKIQRCSPNVCFWNAEAGWLLDGTEQTSDSETWTDENFAGWTPIVRPLEPNEPEPEQAQKPRCEICKCEYRSNRPTAGCECPCHPSMERATIQLFSAAQESVALGQPLAQFQALAGVAHAQATQRAARVGR